MVLVVLLVGPEQMEFESKWEGEMLPPFSKRTGNFSGSAQLKFLYGVPEETHCCAFRECYHGGCNIPDCYCWR